jgi:hypothetical protein
VLEERTMQEILALKDSFKAVGQTDFHMYRQPVPWSEVTGVERGGTYRRNIPTNWYFTVAAEGLNFRFNFDIEPASANGTAGYSIDVAAIQDALRRLPRDVARRWSAELSESARLMREEAEKDQEWINKQWLLVKFMEDAISFSPAVQS